MTPILNFCNFACVFCWRMHLPGRFRVPKGWEWDPPEKIVEGAIEAQRKLLIGFKGNPKVTRERFLEAMYPRHMAISLDGEPTLYPMLAELIQEVKRRGMTAFLVTNGSNPYRLRELIRKGAEPTNLYISVYGPDEETFVKAAQPRIPRAWDLVLQSLDLMHKFKNSRTIFRMTMVRNLTLVKPEGYAKLIEMSEPHFVELKGYTWVGESQKRLPISAMPTLEELESFARKLEKLTGYKIKEVDRKSRVVMLVKDEDTWTWNLELVKKLRYEIEKMDEKEWRGKVKDFRFKR